LFGEARTGDAISLRGPAGDCFYTAGDPAQPLLLVGTGTGLAPLIGICRDAIRQQHTGPIYLYHGSRDVDGLYLQSELRALSRSHANVHYIPVVPELESERTAVMLTRTIAAAHPSLAGWRGFVCGNPPAVSALKLKMFMLGMPSKEIFVDAFVEAPKPG
jgi:CDP-4-dehydro-6-deoxyglucose reductase